MNIISCTGFAAAEEARRGGGEREREVDPEKAYQTLWGKGRPSFCSLCMLGVKPQVSFFYELRK